MGVEWSEKKRREGGRQRQLNKIGAHGKFKGKNATPKPGNTRQQVRKGAQVRKNG